MSTRNHLVKRKLKSFPDDVSKYSITQCIQLVRLALSLDPKSAQLTYYLAYFYAVDGKPSQSLTYMRRAMKLGFRSIRLITHSAVFRNVRQLRGFTELITEYLE